MYEQSDVNPSLLTRRYSNHSAPILQSRPRSFVRKLATFCLPLLDMKPVIANSLMLASTKGTPVRPSGIKNYSYSQLQIHILSIHLLKTLLDFS